MKLRPEDAKALADRCGELFEAAMLLHVIDDQAFLDRLARETSADVIETIFADRLKLVQRDVMAGMRDLAASLDPAVIAAFVDATLQRMRTPKG